MVDGKASHLGIEVCFLNTWQDLQHVFNFCKTYRTEQNLLCNNDVFQRTRPLVQESSQMMNQGFKIPSNPGM